MAIATLSVKLQAQIAEFQAEFKEAAKSTEKFQDSFQATATKASAYGNLIARGLEIGLSAIQQLGEAALKNASTIDDLSKKTGLSMRTIQEFQHVADQTGTTVDTFANAAFRLGTNLAGGSNSVVRGVEDLGLAFKDVRDLRVDEQFKTIIKALEDMEDQQEANRIGVILFGRSYKEVAVAVAEGYSDIANGARIMSEEQVKRLAAAEDAWSRFGRTVTIVSGEVLASALKQIDLASQSWANFFESLTPAGAVRVQFQGEDVGPPKAPKPPELFQSKALATLQQDLLDLASQKTLEGLNAPLKAVRALSDETKRADFKSLADDIKLVAERSDDLGDAFDRASADAKEMGDDLQSLRDDIRAVDEAFTKTDDAFWGEEQKESIRSLKEDIQSVADIVGTPPPMTLWQEFGEGLTHIIAGAFAGRGIKQSVEDAASLLGATFGKSLAKTLTTGANAITGWLGDLVNAALPAIGSILGPLVGKIGDLIQGAFGNRGRDAVKEFAESFGGFDALHKRLLELGAAGEQLWIRLTQGVGRNNPEQARAAIDAINQALGVQSTRLQNAQSVLDEYGITFEQTGQKFRDASIAAAFDELFEKTLTLKEIGVDYSLILEKQAEQFSELTKKAIESGTEIPSSMRPVLEQLRDMGLLTDKATGEFIDLGNVQWSKSLTQGFRDVTDAIDRLTFALTGVGRSATDTARDIEREFSGIKIPNIQVGVDFNVGKLPNPDFTQSVPALGDGAVVRRPTLALVGESGPEAVVPLSQLGSVGGGGSSTVIFEIDGRQIAAATVPYLPGEVRRYIPA